LSNRPDSCQIPCACGAHKHDAQLIVLTGGPGAGKTAVLEFIRKVLCEHVAILPEAATILFSGGFWRLDSLSAKRSSQRAIYHVQEEMQNLVLNEKKWAVGLCDRGTLDGAAYWPGEESEFYNSLHTEKNDELQKYKAVIHMQSPAASMGYNHQNPVRTETAEMAALIDEKIHHVWKDHPKYHFVKSADTFLHKMDNAIRLIQSYIPECCREHFNEIKK
jgi:hypothetical protein